MATKLYVYQSTYMHSHMDDLYKIAKISLYFTRRVPPHVLFQVVPTQNLTRIHESFQNPIYYHLLFQLLLTESKSTLISIVVENGER
jgi:hypothetical protein